MRYSLFLPVTIFMLLKNSFAKFRQHDVLGTGFPIAWIMQYLYLITGVHALESFAQLFVQRCARIQAIKHLLSTSC